MPNLRSESDFYLKKSKFLRSLVKKQKLELYLEQKKFCNTIRIIIKALKTLVWHLSREQMREISSLKK